MPTNEEALVRQERRKAPKVSLLTGTHVISWNSFWQSGHRFVIVAQLSMHVKQNLKFRRWAEDTNSKLFLS